MTNMILGGQLIKLQAEFTRLKKDNDPRVNGPAYQCYPESRDGRIQWARDHLGLPKLSSFSDLTQKQAEYLIDTLVKGVNKTKLDGQIKRELARLGVHNDEAYFINMIAKSLIWKFGVPGSLIQLNRYQKYKLCEILASRSPAQTDRPAPVERAPTRPAVTVSGEQRTLWGLK